MPIYNKKEQVGQKEIQTGGGGVQWEAKCFSQGMGWEGLNVKDISTIKGKASGSALE